MDYNADKEIMVTYRNFHEQLRYKYGLDTRKSVRKYEKTLQKQSRWEGHHIFSMRCRDEGVIPTSLRVKPLVRSSEGYRIARRASKSFLSERIRQTYIQERLRSEGEKRRGI